MYSTCHGCRPFGKVLDLIQQHRSVISIPLCLSTPLPSSAACHQIDPPCSRFEASPAAAGRRVALASCQFRPTGCQIRGISTGETPVPPDAISMGRSYSPTAKRFYSTAQGREAHPGSTATDHPTPKGLHTRGLCNPFGVDGRGGEPAPLCCSTPSAYRQNRNGVHMCRD